MNRIHRSLGALAGRMGLAVGLLLLAACDPNVSFTPAMGTVSGGQSIKLSWTTSDADTCTADQNWIGATPPYNAGDSLPLSGSVTLSYPPFIPNHPYPLSFPYSMTCQNLDGTGGAAAAITVTPYAPLPTASLSANPTSIAVGQSSSLSWSSANANSCAAGGAWSGSLPTSGSQTVSPTATATYTLTCTGPGGSSAPVTAIVTVTTPPPPPPTASVSVLPTSISAGATAMLSWSSTNATSCTAGGAWSGVQSTSGSQSVSPAATATYTLVCMGPGGTSAAASTTLNVTSAPPPPTASLGVTPTNIKAGMSATLNWSSANATSCTAGGAWSGAQPTSGTQSVTPSTTSTYTLACTGPGGSTAPSPATVTVTPVGSGGAALFTVDSTNTLYSFDAGGNLLRRAAITGPIANLNGGGITVANGIVYVTLGQPANGVAAYNEFTLQPVTLAAGSFAGLNVPRGIAYDSNNSRIYVANGGASVTAYDGTGIAQAVSGSFPNHYGPSGIAFDATHNTLWVANLFGAPWSSLPVYGVAEYDEAGNAAQSFGYGSQFAPPVNAVNEQPYGIAYCTGSGTPAPSAANVVPVGFVNVSGSSSGGLGQTFDTSGNTFGPLYVTTLTNPHAMTCTYSGDVFVGDDSGLLEFNVSGSRIGPAVGAYAGMTPPVYGVYAPNSTPAVFVVDSSNTLFSYDTEGNLLHSAALPGTVGALGGGGLTVANGNVYVTLGAPSNSVVAYNEFTLQPVTLTGGAFAGLNNPRGIAFAADTSRFFVTNGNASVNVYDVNGAAVTVTGAFPFHNGPSGIAYSATDHTLWVANYVGALDSPPTAGVQQYDESGNPYQTTNYSTEFVPPAFAGIDEPYAIAYCAGSGFPAGAANVVAVGFVGYSSSVGAGIGQNYSALGGAYGSTFGTQYVGTLSNPHAMSCSSHGQIYVATDSGLLEYNVTGSAIGPPAGAFAGLTAPVYGVFVTN